MAELVENTVGKEKLLVTSNFYFFPQCFQKICIADTKKPGLFGKGLKQDTIKPCIKQTFAASNSKHVKIENSIDDGLNAAQTIRFLSRNILGKGENLISTKFPRGHFLGFQKHCIVL